MVLTYTVTKEQSVVQIHPLTFSAIFKKVNIWNPRYDLNSLKARRGAIIPYASLRHQPRQRWLKVLQPLVTSGAQCSTASRPRIVLLLDKHHDHLNQKPALTFGSSDYGAYPTFPEYITAVLQQYYGRRRVFFLEPSGSGRESTPLCWKTAPEVIKRHHCIQPYARYIYIYIYPIRATTEQKEEFFAAITHMACTKQSKKGQQFCFLPS